MSRSAVERTREQLRGAEDELTRASHLHSTLHEFAEKRGRGAPADAADAERAFEKFLQPGPNRSPADRKQALGYLNGAHVTPEGANPTDFFTAATGYVSDARSNDGTDSTKAGGTSLSTLLSEFDGYVNRSTGIEKVVSTFATLAASNSVPMAGHLAAVTGLLVQAAQGRRDGLVDGLNNDYPDDAEGGEQIASKGAIQQYVDSVDDAVAELADDQPLALLPVRLETRFIGDDREEVDSGTELWVRVYPDAIHHDSHEEQLTDVEVRWGRNFWGYLWLGTHRTLDAIDQSYLQGNLPSGGDGRLAAMLADLDPAAFPSDPRERKDAIKERAWNQLLDRFGRERAAYVVQELKPTHWETLADTSKIVDNDSTSSALGESGGALEFPAVERKPDAWTKPPVARLLPDQWIAYGVFAHEGSNYRTTFTVRSNAIREPLPVGPTPEAMAVAEQYGSGTPGAAGGSDDVIDTDADLAWITDFGEAEKAGMAFRVRDGDVFDGSAPSAVSDVSDGRFEKLVVVGAKASTSPDAAATELERLFEAHHYTDGLELVEQGTPTNNYDVESGYTSEDDPRESMQVECAPPLIEHGDNTDGDKLARALGIDPVTTNGDEHVFAHVENADADHGTRAWHANSALWSGTLGYYFQNMLTQFDPPIPSGSHWWTEMVDKNDVREWAGVYESTRRHFIDYVRAQGPLPAFRADTQPYGVLPAMPMDEDYENVSIEDAGDASAFDPVGDVQNLGRFENVGDVQNVGSILDESAVDVSSLQFPFGNGESTEEDPAAAWESSSREEFRKNFSAVEAHGSIPEEELAATYPPEETALVLPKRKMATYYSPDEAASVLSNDDLARYYDASALVDADVNLDGRGI